MNASIWAVSQTKLGVVRIQPGDLWIVRLKTLPLDQQVKHIKPSKVKCGRLICKIFS